MVIWYSMYIITAILLLTEAAALVVGTGDLSELALGWATYNGDHMSMYGVNASVPKNPGALPGCL